MRDVASIYGVNWTYSYLYGSNFKKIDLSEYRTIKNGGYKKLLNKYFETYDSDAKIQENTVGLLFDQYV